MKVYTKNGDSGKTSLLSERVSKTNMRIEVNGQLDELMVELAFLLEKFRKENEEKYYYDMQKVYKNLFTITSMIADVKQNFGYQLKDREVEKLENGIDEMTKQLPSLRHFIFYTGTESAMLCQKVRAKVRSVERIVVNLYEQEPVDNNILIYLNRLSDYFYTLGRYINMQNGFEEDKLKI